MYTQIIKRISRFVKVEAGSAATGAGTFLLAMATLTLEVALTRVFALAHGYHFAFLTIGISLLGLGAGGTSLSLRRAPIGKALPGLLSLAFAITTASGYLLSNAIPFDMYRIAWERIQVVYLLGYYLALATPFFCSGLTVGALLRTARGKGKAYAGHRVYAVNLIGSAAGALLALWALSRVGEAGAVMLSAAGGGLAATAFALDTRPGGRWRRPIMAFAGLGCAIGMSYVAATCPSWIKVRLSPYRPLRQALQFPGARLAYTRQDAFSRVDVVQSEAIHIAPGLSLNFAGPTPRQMGLYVDANGRGAIACDGARSLKGWAAQLPIALAYRLRPRADVLVLTPGGGSDVAVARALGAGRVTVVSPNRLVVDAVRRYGGDLYADERIKVVVSAPRTFARRHRMHGRPLFDLVVVSLSDAQRTVVSGGYALNEDYGYTVQAFADYLRLLKPGGMLVVQRWLQTPPSESIRAWTLAATALAELGGTPSHQMAAIRSWSTMLILVKRGTLVAGDESEIRRFCRERHFDLVYLPDIKLEEANRYNVYPGAPYANALHELLTAEGRASYYRRQRYDIRPPTDDRPFFFHFFTWRQLPEVWRSLGHTWQPFGGGGYLVVVAMLGVALLAAGVLIVLPLVARGRLPGMAVVAYFGCLGFAYLGVEIPLIQRLGLLLERPTLSFTIVVSTMLIASGAGSWLMPRIVGRWVPFAVAGAVAVVTVSLPALCEAALGWPPAARLTTTVVTLIPLGVLMGMPFPAGLKVLSEHAPDLIPWAWGVNGGASVVASILTALITLEWGYSAALSAAGAAYLVAGVLFLAMNGTRPH